MTHEKFFGEDIFANAISVLKEDCKISRGYSAQIVGEKSTSAASTAIIAYVLNKLGYLSIQEKELLEKELLSFKILEPGHFLHSIGNVGSSTVWSTSQACFALIEMGATEDSFFDSVNWLCRVQSADGGWSYNGKKTEPSRIGYCLYTVLVLKKFSRKTPQIRKALFRAEMFVKGYQPQDTCEQLIQYFLLMYFDSQYKDELQEQSIISNFIQDNSIKLYNYMQDEPGSGGHHFYVPWYVPSFYMLFRKFLSPDHPIVIFLMRLLLDYLIDQRGWSSRLQESKIYSWATALSILSIHFWDRNCLKRNIKIERLCSLSEIRNIMTTYKEETMMPGYMSKCPMNGGKCNKREEIRLKYRDTNVFLDIPYQNSYLTFEYQIRNTLKARGMDVIIAKDSVGSNVLLCKVCELIQTCKYGVADISEDSLNIPFELGLLYGLGKTCAILKNKNAKYPSDIQGVEYIQYENTLELDKKLNDWIDTNTQVGEQTNGL